MPSSSETVDLRSGRMALRLVSRGAATQGWWLDDVPLILGYEAAQDYVSDPFYLGAIAGPVANRIGGARYNYEGQEVALVPNEGENLLHSGGLGLSNRDWTIEPGTGSETAHLSCAVDAGSDGFPGSACFDLHVTLGDNRLTYQMTAHVDCARPISLAQHNYYTLGASSGKDLQLQVSADRVLGLSSEMVADGSLEVLFEQGLDFHEPRPLHDVTGGIDRFFVRSDAPDLDHPIATLMAPSGLKMRVYSDQPGAQVYTGHGLSSPFVPWAGVCIEPSGYPNAVNQPGFPSMMCTPDKPYSQTLILELVE